MIRRGQERECYHLCTAFCDPGFGRLSIGDPGRTQPKMRHFVCDEPPCPLRSTFITIEQALTFEIKHDLAGADTTVVDNLSWRWTTPAHQQQWQTRIGAATKP